jgi:sugar/nucleoside kinase (ribokinase family)
MTLSELAAMLRTGSRLLDELPVVTGFDGFVDEMITVVDERQDLVRYRRVETIQHFGELIAAAAGHSSLREIVVTRADPGGCAINMGDGLAALGLPVTTFATVGEPVHAAFADYAGLARLHSWGREPGRTLAFEFADGKLMFSAVTQLAEFTPAALDLYLAEGAFHAACSKARLIALTDWSLYPHMTACWQKLQRDVFAGLGHRPHFFLDLVDPSSRADADIRAMIEVLPGFAACGPTTLGLNQNEANILARLTGGAAPARSDIDAAATQAAMLRESLGISEVVIHGQKYAAMAAATGPATAWGPYCPQPKKSTGAGDRFNAGYALGLLLELPPATRLQLATATSGLYVREGRSPTLGELAAFIERWDRDPAHCA